MTTKLTVVVTVADVRIALHDAVDAGAGDLLLDLSGVNFIDASGLGTGAGSGSPGVPPAPDDHPSPNARYVNRSTSEPVSSSNASAEPSASNS